MTDINLIRYEEVDNKVRAYSHHAFLESADLRPHASRFQFQLARTVLSEAGLSRQSSLSVLEAVLLLHRGLAIHEEVDHSVELQRQLRVLAGDYCSSQYYFIIARVGDERLVRALSDSVVRINEAKMTLYPKTVIASGRDHMQLLQTIHGDLVYSLCSRYLADDESWLNAMHAAVLGYIIHLELKRPNPSRPFSLVQAREWLTEARERFLQSPPGKMLGPLRTFMTDTWDSLQGLLEEQSLVEGKR